MEQRMILRMQGADRLGSRYYRQPTWKEYSEAVTTLGEEQYRSVLVAWNVFQWKHRMLGLTVFRRWLRIFHPGLTVWVYNR